MVHGILAGALNNPLLALDKEKEADALADSVAKVMSHYGDIPGLNEKTLDWLGLIGTASMIYGSRIVAVRKMRADRVPKQAPAPQPASTAQMPQAEGFTVVDIPGVGKVETPLQ